MVAFLAQGSQNSLWIGLLAANLAPPTQPLHSNPRAPPLLKTLDGITACLKDEVPAPQLA